MRPGIDHVVLGEIAKVGQDHFGKVSLPHPISAALSGGLVRRSRNQRSNREGDPAVSRAISGGVREMGMSSLLAYLTRSSYARLASASIKSEVRGHKSNVSAVRRLG